MANHAYCKPEMAQAQCPRAGESLDAASKGPCVRLRTAGRVDESRSRYVCYRLRGHQCDAIARDIDRPSLGDSVHKTTLYCKYITEENPAGPHPERLASSQKTWKEKTVRCKC